MARDLVPSPVRRAVERLARMVTTPSRAVTLAHRVWFLHVARAHGVLPLEAPEVHVAALSHGDPDAVAALTTPWFNDLVKDAHRARLAEALAPLCIEFADCDALPGDLGRTYEALATQGRKSSGRYYTASGLVDAVVQSALGDWLRDGAADKDSCITVCDPACGGGAFLLAALDVLASATHRERFDVMSRCLHGIDVDAGAVSVAAMALWLAGGVAGACFADFARNIVHADALGNRLWKRLLPRAFDREQPGFDVVLGNPPWVGYAGRSTRPITPARRTDLHTRFEGFRGFPSLHGAFVTRASSWLRPRGVLGFVLPSSMADLAGYASARTSHTALCEPLQPLEEFGEDAFGDVCQPCFALVARRRDADVVGSPARWVLRERGHARAPSIVVQPPAAVTALAEHPRFPPGLFGEWGFQSAGDIVRAYTVRADAPTDTHPIGLCEGRDVEEFRVGPPRRYLSPDPEALRRAQCRLRTASEWSRAVLVIRQTARHPLAALYGRPVAFRNSLLAGFAVEGWEPALVVALLNSSLLRAVHRAAQRDGRQRAFPQVKVAHLRALPAPRHRDPVTEAELVTLTLAWTARAMPLTHDDRIQLDVLTCNLYGVAPTETERENLRKFVTGAPPVA